MARADEVISHWHHSVEEFNTSAISFYDAISATLRAKAVPTVKIERIDWNESGILSAKREYLRVSHARYSFDICAAPFGKDFFFSWWLTRRAPAFAALYGVGTLVGLAVVFLGLWNQLGLIKGTLWSIVLIAFGVTILKTAIQAGRTGVEDAILAMPFISALYIRFFRPATYYATDSRLIFEEAVHRVVTRQVDTLLTVAKLPPLTLEATKQSSRAPLA